MSNIPMYATWHYENGKRTATTFIEDNCRDGETIEALIERLGYESFCGRIGCETPSAISLNVFEREEAPRYLIDISTSGSWYFVTAAELPDLMDLLAAWTPIVASAEIAYALSDIGNLERSGFGLLTNAAATLRVNEQEIDETVYREQTRRAEERSKIWKRMQERQQKKATAE